MKKTVAKYLCIILSAALLLTALPLTVYADSNEIDVYTADELTTACNEITENGGEYTINLKRDIDNGAIVIKNPDAVVTVNGNGCAITNHKNAVNVSGGATVKLSGGSSTLTLQGSDDPHEIPVGNDDSGLIYVLYGSTCTMSANVTLKNHKGDNYLGGGVSVEGGSFVMNGGNIDNCGIGSGSVCYGGGVAVYNGGYFEMNGGSITNCYAISDYVDDYDPNRCFTAVGGGVFVTKGSSFTMNGGTISGCEATNMGGGVAQIIFYDEMRSCGMGNLQSTVTINDGTISGNKAGNGAGVFSSAYFYCYADAIRGYESGGIGTQPNPGLYINGGKINQNEADGSGGGVYIAMLRPNTVFLHNAEITKNKAYDGAGIDIFGYWTKTDIDNCTITDNVAESNGGGLEITLNSSGGQTFLKNTTITGNESGGRGAGVYYDSNSKLTISGANIIQDNYYNNVLNNLNIFSQANPVYINGDLTGSKVGLSDPTLWDDGKEDTDPEAVSTGYLTSGYKTNNSNLSPSAAFTSDHESWLVDYSDTNINEVRLVRKKPNYHINNTDIANAKYNGDDIFTSYVEAATKEIKVGDTIEEFYTIPEVKATESSSCPYIFKGWYYDKENDNDTRPVTFGTDKYSKDIYAHWIKVENVAKNADDDNELPPTYNNSYGGFDLVGVQVREGIRDTNYGYEKMPGGLRFVTSLNMDVVNQINAIKPNNIEYGYVAATNEGWINYHHAAGRKLQYASTNTNGIDTSSDRAKNENYFGFASNINCTSRKTNGSGIVNEDHRNFDGYLLYTLVITYENVEESAKAKDTNVLARPYIKYLDANGLERVAYSEYRGNSNTLGGCYTSYNAIAGNN